MWKWSVWFYLSFFWSLLFPGPSASVLCASPTYLPGWEKGLSVTLSEELLPFQLKELLGLGRQRPTSEISFSGIYEDQVITSSFSFFSNWLLLMLWKPCAVFVLRMEKYVQAVDGWWNEPDWPYSWGNLYASFILSSCIQWCSLNLYEF